LQIDRYQELALRTESDFYKGADFETALLVSTAGLQGEVGEFANKLKKFFEKDQNIDRAVLADELGDIFWYAVKVAQVLNVLPSAVLDENLAKLAARHPNGYDANARADQSERDE
jgi:NTP pyrophosphatase (non-canonical NTP hydrolase)